MRLPVRQKHWLKVYAMVNRLTPDRCGRGPAAEGPVSLARKRVRIRQVAGGVMEQNEVLCAGLAGDRAGFPRGEMETRGRQRPIAIEKDGLDEELVRVLGERENFAPVVRIGRCIRHVGDDLAGTDPEQALLDPAERDAAVAGDRDSEIVGLPRRTASLAPFSQGPTGRPSSSRAPRHTLTR